VPIPLLRLFVDLHRVETLLDVLPTLIVLFIFLVVVIVIVGDFLAGRQVTLWKLPQLLDDFGLRFRRADGIKVDDRGTDFVDGTVFNDLESHKLVLISICKDCFDQDYESEVSSSHQIS